MNRGESPFRGVPRTLENVGKRGAAWVNHVPPAHPYIILKSEAGRGGRCALCSICALQAFVSGLGDRQFLLSIVAEYQCQYQQRHLKRRRTTTSEERTNTSERNRKRASIYICFGGGNPSDISPRQRECTRTSTRPARKVGCFPLLYSLMAEGYPRVP